MKWGSLFFSVILLLITIFLLIAAIPYPFMAKQFPMIALFTALILLIVQIILEASALKEEKPTGMVKTKGYRSKHLAIWTWLVGTLIMLWVLGFMVTVVLLPFLYLRFQGEDWLITIVLPLGCGVFFYTVFSLALSMPLYPGILFLKIFG